MARERFQTLTEQMFYTLMCFADECCGTDVMERAREMTDGRVRIGSGTLYNLIEQFLDAALIEETRVEGRKKSYLLTQKGRETLENEYQRLRQQMADYERMRWQLTSFETVMEKGNDYGTEGNKKQDILVRPV